MNQGKKLHQFLEDERCVPDHVILLIKTGEENGTLARQLDHVIFNLKSQRNLNSHLRNASIYIISVLLIFSMVESIMSSKVYGTFHALQQFGAFSVHFMTAFCFRYMHLIVIILNFLTFLLICLFLFHHFFYTPAHLLQWIPFARSFMFRKYRTWILTQLVAGIENGTFSAGFLREMGKVLPFQRWRESWEHVCNQVEEGVSWKDLEFRGSLFDPMLRKAFRSIGSVDGSWWILNTCRKESERMSFYASRKFAILAEPLAILAIGILVAVYLSSLYLFAFSIPGQIHP